MKHIPRFDLAVHRVNPDDDLFYSGMDLPIESYDDEGNLVSVTMYENCQLTSWASSMPEGSPMVLEPVARLVDRVLPFK